MALKVPTQSNKIESLIAGYIKNQLPTSIPSEIIKIILVFFDLVFHWVLNTDQMQNSISKGTEQIDSNKIIDVDGILFTCGIYKSGSLHGPNSYQYGVKCNEIPAEIDYIGVYAYFSCIQTGFTGFAAIRFTRFTINGMEPIARSEVDKMLNFVTEKDINEICIDCFIEIQYIKYRSSANESDYNILPPMKILSTVHVWNISGKDLKKLQDKDVRSVLLKSPRFDDNRWSAILARHRLSYQAHEDAKLFVSISFPLLQMGIFGLNFELMLKHKNSDEYRSREIKVTKISTWADSGLRVKDILNDTNLEIKAKLKICGCQDKDGNVIDKSRWNDYGIVE